VSEGRCPQSNGVRLAIATVELSREGSDSPNKPNNYNDDQDKHNCSHSDVQADPPL
jgi:hypothetical protein